MNYKFYLSVAMMHFVFIIAGYFVLNYSIFLLLSQTTAMLIFGYIFLICFFALCVCIHYLVVDTYDEGTSSTKRKWLLSLGNMCVSTGVAIFVLAFMF